MSAAHNFARDTQQVQPTAEPAPVAVPVADEVPAVIHCKDCTHWNLQFSGASVASCRMSGKWLPTPIYTTDLSTCSKAELRS